MGLVTDCAISYGSWWSSPARLIIFHFLDHLVVVGVSLAAASMVTYFDLGRETGSINLLSVATDNSWYLVHLVEVRGAESAQCSGCSIVG